MDQLAALRTFRCLLEAGSFTGAAQRLGTSHTSVSRQLRQLETHLGVRLLHRNSRGFTATDAGTRYYRDCIDILDRLDAAAERLASEATAPSGVLRLSLPHAIAALELPQWLPAFVQHYPQVQLDLSCDDRLVDLVKGGFDMAIRISGPLPDSTLVAHELAVSDRVLVAAPQYIARLGLPRRADELSAHRLLAYSGDGDAIALSDDDGAACDVALGRDLRVDSIVSLHAAAIAGLGIAAMTRTTVRDDLASGRLVRVLPRHRAGRRHYFAVYPHNRQLAPKVRAFTQFMRAHYAAHRACPGEAPPGPEQHRPGAGTGV